MNFQCFVIKINFLTPKKITHDLILFLKVFYWIMLHCFMDFHCSLIDSYCWTTRNITLPY